MVPVERKYISLAKRERLLVALALVLGPLLIGNALFIDPQRARINGVENTIATESASAAQLQAEAANLQQQLSIDPDAGRKAELAALNGERDKLDEQLRQLGSALVRPDEMNGLLEGLLARHQGLRLLSLKTLAPQSVCSAKKRQRKVRPRLRSEHSICIDMASKFGLKVATACCRPICPSWKSCRNTCCGGS